LLEQSAVRPGEEAGLCCVIILPIEAGGYTITFSHKLLTCPIYYDNIQLSDIGGQEMKYINTPTGNAEILFTFNAENDGSIPAAMHMRYHASIPLRLIHGDCSELWICTPASAAKLERAGYEVI
jgi:hypothetical protein